MGKKIFATICYFHLVSAGNAEIVENWKEEIDGDGGRNSVTNVDDYKLNAELIILVGNAEKGNR